MSQNPETIVIVPCYKRPEYTAKCIRALEEAQGYENTLFYLIDDGSNDGTAEILRNAKFAWKHVIVNPSNCGLRNVLINAFQIARTFKYAVKVDNDCLVPKDWLKDITKFLESGWVDVVSPNVHPSNAAFKHGSAEDPARPGIRPSKIVGGLWAMRTELIKDVYFEPMRVDGIRGAFSLLKQILIEKDPRVGWLPEVIVQDVGHWSGEHPEHIKSQEHLDYSVEVGRNIAWA